MQAVSAHNRWNSYLMDSEGPSKLVFSLREPKSRLLIKKSAVKISINAKENGKDWDFEVKGSFSERACTFNDRRGNVVAQVSKLTMQYSCIQIQINHETDSTLTCTFFFF